MVEALVTDSEFRQGVEDLAASLGLEPEPTALAARKAVDDLAAVHSDALPDFSLVLSRIADRRAFEGALVYDVEAVERLRAANQDRSLVLLTAHRSYLDFVVRVPLAKGGIAREYRFAGANIDFWPIGSILRKVGMIFIRRGDRDPVYTYALRRYVAWLTERQANFMWAIEGGRTRTGKLLRPKAGLLAYVADAYVNGSGRDVALIPATVVWEYLDEVKEYARYGRGATKSSEGIGFLIRLTRQQRRVPAGARIHIGLGAPLSLADYVTRGETPEAVRSGVERAAMDVCRGIDKVTPISGVSLVLLPLLAHQGDGLTVEELVERLRPVSERIALKGLPAGEDLIGGEASVHRALSLLGAQNVIDTVSGTGSESARYRVNPGSHLEAAYYRNAILHHFLIRSVVELGLELGANAPAGENEPFWSAVGEIRDLFDLEFFWPNQEDLRAAVAAELPDSLPTVTASDLGDSYAPWVLRSLLESYLLVANGLVRLGGLAVTDRGRLARDCLDRGQLELTVGRLRCADAVSLHMFEIPLDLARQRGLLEAGTQSARSDMAVQITRMLDAIDRIEVAASDRQATLL